MPMTESLTISNAPLEHPSMDYALLQKEAIETISKLSGNCWTDYNSHDPGITILETLCYAITDLSYRLDFAMEDLLAYPANGSEHQPLFLTARDILTVNPTTIDDYRKLLIDIDGIKNAWLEPIDIPQPELYYNANKASLSFSSLNLAEPVNLRGLYRVLLEKEPSYQDQDLVKAATAQLQQRRNLCEDFAEIRVLPIEKITIKADIEISDHVNPNQLMAELYTALEREISPSIKFSSLSELLEQDIPVEAIFTGPRLDHGFIDDKQLQKFQRKDELHTSDLIHIMLDMPGINAVRKITLSSDRSPTDQEWALDLDHQLTPILKSFKEAIAVTEADKEDFKFYKGQIKCSLNTSQIEAIKTDFSAKSDQSFSPYSPQDLPIPTGNYRELSDYVTIQNEFPLNYGIGDIGLPGSATAARKAQAKQLQAYLIVFDQLLANYFAQLDNVKKLFSLGDRQIKTYFTQSIDHFPGAKAILKDSYDEYLGRSPIGEEAELERKNRFLDHLIAQYGETFTNYSLLYQEANLSPNTIDHKVDFALDYRAVSAGRNNAFNYTLDPNQNENFNNVSGLKRRIARLLGIEPDRQFLASSDNIEGFYLLEHILLRPRLKPEFKPDESQDFLSFSQAITEFKVSTMQSGYVTCTSPNHGLKVGDRLDIFYSINYNGTYTVANIEADTFDINHDFVSQDKPDSGAWVSSNQFPDPFSFQISVILPDWLGRLNQPNFRQLTVDTFVAETSAHITLHFHWFDQPKMQDFETTYAIWLQQLSNNNTETMSSRDYTNRLITLLELGSSTIQQPPALLGYMSIVENDQDAVENPFKII